MEQEFVARAQKKESAPRGWPAALLMFHVGMWRERMRNALTDIAEGRTPAAPPPAEQQDEFNDAELANGIGTPLADAAARAEHLLGEIVGLYERLGVRPFDWYRSHSTSEAIIGNSYTHPRLHIYEYLVQNDEHAHAYPLWEQALDDLRDASASPFHMGAAKYNLGCVRLLQDRSAEALDLLAEAFQLRPDLKAHAVADSDLESLLENPRFQELVKG